MKNSKNSRRRVIWIVLDGVGAGELPDANVYGDLRSNTLGNTAREFLKLEGRNLDLNNLQKIGLGNITPMLGVPPQKDLTAKGAFGRATEVSRGKDTTSGHWEMAGLVLEKPFTVFPNGFSAEVINEWAKECHLPGVLGNKAASGTDIIKELGEEHVATGKPILYTSADSVWQVAAHEEAFGLDRLYSICKVARKICDRLQIGRVIARPFIGNPGAGVPFKRTYHRKDYAQKPFAKTFLDYLGDEKISVLGIGKISNIYAGVGIPANIDTEGNADGLRVLLEQMAKVDSGLIFCNLIDFDMLYGHRRDVRGFGLALEEFDRFLPQIQAAMTEDDLLLMTADHGNDPTFAGTDHTREYAPILAYSPAMPKLIDLGIRGSFGDLGATTWHFLSGRPSTGAPLSGESFLPVLGLH